MCCCDGCCIILGILASACSVVALTLAWNYLQIRLFYTRTHGRIHEIYHDESFQRCCSVIRFSDRKGREIEFEYELSPQLKIDHGQKVPVTYHPTFPTDAYVYFHSHGELRLSLMLGIAALFTLLTFAELFWQMFKLSF